MTIEEKITLLLNRCKLTHHRLVRNLEIESERNPFGYTEGFLKGGEVELTYVINQLESILNDNRNN